MKHVRFHLPSFLRRVRIHGGEFDSSARAMNRVKQVRLLQADLRIVRGSTIERKQMSTKTTFKRIALVAVAALGFGVLSVVPSQAEVSGLIVTATNGTGATVGTKSDSTTAATLNIQFLALNSAATAPDSVTVDIVAASALPTGATVADLELFFTESTTSVTTVSPTVDTNTSLTAENSNGVLEVRALPYDYSNFRVIAPENKPNATSSVKIKVGVESATALAGTYSLNAIVKSLQGGVTKTDVIPFNIVVAAPAVVVAVPAAANATAVLEAGNPASVTSISDSATAGSFATSTTPIGKILVTNRTSLGAAANDTITVTLTGSGLLKDSATATTGRSFVLANIANATISVLPDGSSGTGTITITTVAGASFTKTVTFFDTKPVTATAAVAKAYIKAGATTGDVFAITVKDTLGNAVTDGGVTVTAAATDTTTTVGGAATCAWNVKGAAYHCSVAGKAADKFGPVAYTITVTGTGTNLATKITTTATTTFADNVATKAVLAGPSTGTPGETVEYTLTLTEKNGYPVADMIYGAGAEATGGDIFSPTATDRVVSGWITAPFSASDSFTAKSGVITSKGTLPIAGVATGSWTLVGNGVTTASTDAIDKTIGKTKLTVTTETNNPGVDAATDAANEATDAANAATDAALAAAEAADAATSAAQEASDAVAALSESVTQLIAGLQSQIKALAKVVNKIAKQTKK